MLLHCCKELYSNRYFHRTVEICKIIFYKLFFINGCKMHCHLLVKRIFSEYQIYKICPQIASWTCLTFLIWLFLTLCKYPGFIGTFPSLKIQLCKKISGEILSILCLLSWLLNVLSTQRNQVDRHGECQAVVITPLMLQQLARVCNGKRKGGRWHGALIPFSCARGGWK